MKGKYQALAIAGLLLLWMLTGIATSGDAAEDKTTFSGQALQSVQVLASRAQNYQPPIRVRAETVANRHVMVPARISAVVARLPLKEGTVVEAGQVLCELEEEDRRSILAEAEGRLRVANVNLEGIQRLQSKSLSSPRALAEAEATREHARATVKRARLKLQHTRIEAPFAGLVDTIPAEEGALLNVGQTCAVLLDLNPIRVRGDVAEAEVEAVRPDARASVQLTNGLTAKGQLTYVGRSANTQSRTFRVEAEVPNPGLSLREGLTADLVIDGTLRRAHLIPASSLILNPEAGIVVKILDENDHVQQLPVEILHDTAEGLWVAGLPDYTRVITVGHYYVKPGQQIRGEEAPEKTPEGELTES